MKEVVELILEEYQARGDEIEAQAFVGIQQIMVEV
jgi:predicted RNase H-like HicB family nuclease